MERGAKAVQGAWQNSMRSNADTANRARSCRRSAYCRERAAKRRGYRQRNGGNICRCATYVRVRAAIHLAAKELA